jgi:hypothetical protein
MDTKEGALKALHAAAASLGLAGLAVKPDAEYAWLLPAAQGALSSAAGVVEQLPLGQAPPHRRALSEVLKRLSSALPHVRDDEATEMAQGLASAVFVIRRWGRLAAEAARPRA